MSDSFLETNVPLLMMIEAAQAGNEAEVEDCAVLFAEHAAKLEEVSYALHFLKIFFVLLRL